MPKATVLVAVAVALAVGSLFGFAMRHLGPVARRSPARAAPLVTAPPVDIALGDAPVRGNPHAPVTVVEFSDFQCPACRRAEATVQALRERYGDRVRLVWKQLPLEEMHPFARAAAEAALAAGEQGKFWEMHDALFADQHHLERADLQARARALGLDPVKFAAALDQHRFAAAIDGDLAQAERLGVRGTPTFFVDGVRVERWPTDLAALIERELARQN